MPAVIPHFQPKSKAQYFAMMVVLVALFGGMVYYILTARATDRSWEVVKRAEALRQDRDFAGATALLLGQIAEEEKSGGPDSPRIPKLLDQLAIVYGEQGKDADAEPVWRRAYDLRKKLLGPDHQEVFGTGDKLGVCLKTQAKFAEAEPLLRRSLALREKAHGPDDAALMPSLHRLASLFLAQRKYAEAEAFARRSVTIARSTTGLIPASLADAKLDLAAALTGLDKFEEAEPLYREGLAAKETQLPKSAHIPAKPGQPSPGDLADLWREFASALRKAGKIREAGEAEQKAAVILSPQLKPE